MVTRRGLPSVSNAVWIHLAWMVKRLLHKQRLWHSLGTYLCDIKKGNYWPEGEPKPVEDSVLKGKK